MKNKKKIKKYKIKSPRPKRGTKGHLPKSYKWLPDWKKAHEYSHLEGASNKQFAWEFLRRNPRFINTRETMEQEGISFEEKSEELQHYIDLYSLDCLPPHPSEKAPAIKFKYSLILSLEMLQNINAMDFNNKKVFLSVDLEGSPEYLDEIMKQLAQIRKERKITQFRPHKSKFIEYLRIYDARMKNYTYDEIAEVIFPNLDNDIGSGSKVRNRIIKASQAADKLVMHSYSFLVS